MVAKTADPIVSKIYRLVVESVSLSLAEGETFLDRYRIERVLGSGGMGKVYLASDLMLTEFKIALKTLHSELCRDPKHKQRFLREVQLNRMLNHPNVVKIFDIGHVGDVLYLTMEFVKGHTLKERLLESKLPVQDVVTILKEICQGLIAVHAEDIIHRDLKPGNVLISDSGEVKIADFGVARPGVSELTAHDEIIGCAPYIAPEVWIGRNVTASADIYALGVMAYEMLVGELPFDGDSPAELMRKHLESKPYPLREIDAETPEWLESLTLQMLEKDPAKRPHSAKAVLEALSRGPAAFDRSNSRREPTTGSLDEDLLKHLRQAEATAANAAVHQGSIPSERSKRPRTLPDWEGEKSRHITPPDQHLHLHESAILSSKVIKPAQTSDFVGKVGTFSGRVDRLKNSSQKYSKAFLFNFASHGFLTALAIITLVILQTVMADVSPKLISILTEPFPTGLSLVLKSIFESLVVTLLSGVLIAWACVISVCQSNLIRSLIGRFIHCVSLLVIPAAFLWLWFAARMIVMDPTHLTNFPTAAHTISSAVITNMVELTLLQPFGTFYRVIGESSAAGVTATHLSLLSAAPYYSALGLMMYGLIELLTKQMHDAEIPSVFTFSVVGSVIVLGLIATYVLPEIIYLAGLPPNNGPSFLVGKERIAVTYTQIGVALINYSTIIFLSRKLLPKAT